LDEVCESVDVVEGADGAFEAVKMAVAAAGTLVSVISLDETTGFDMSCVVESTIADTPLLDGDAACWMVPKVSFPEGCGVVLSSVIGFSTPTIGGANCTLCADLPFDKGMCTACANERGDVDLIDAVFAVEFDFAGFGIDAFFVCFTAGASASSGPLYLRTIFFTPAVRLSMPVAPVGAAAGCDDGRVAGGAELETRRLPRRSSIAPLILRDFRTVTEGWSEVSLALATFAAVTAGMREVDWRVDGSLAAPFCGRGVVAVLALNPTPDLRPLSCIRSTGTGGGSMMVEVRSRLTFTSASSSCLQLSTCLSEGTKSLQSSCVAIGHSTSGAGGEGLLVGALVPDIELYSFEGSTTLALNDLVGDQNACGSALRYSFVIVVDGGCKANSSSLSDFELHQSE